MNDFDKTLRRPPTDPNAPPRVEPLTPPFAADVQAVFDKIMPPGVPPLTLFTTLARVPRIYDRFRAGSLLDRGPVSLRHREIVIDRSCARCGCAYEWGVHIAFFADRAGLEPKQVRATARGDADLIATEFGVAELRGQPLDERVRRMAAISHPTFREDLERAARDIIRNGL